MGLSEIDDEAVRVIDLVNLDGRIGHDVKGLRKARSMTLSALASASGLSQGYLSQIERGLASPSVKALYSISRALGVTISWFFPAAGDDHEILRDFVVRADQRRILQFASGITDELLSPNLDRQIELICCKFPPGAYSGDSSYSHTGEEAGVVLSGELELWVNEKHVVLGPGDSFAFASDIPHRYGNAGDRETVVIWVITPPSY
jgi:transcriptional regulator with XRE-family HTH domain